MKAHKPPRALEKIAKHEEIVELIDSMLLLEIPFRPTVDNVLTEIVKIAEKMSVNFEDPIVANEVKSSDKLLTAEEVKKVFE